MIPNFTAEAALLPGQSTYRAAGRNHYESLTAVPQQFARSNSTLARGSVNDGLDASGCGTIKCPGCQTCHGVLYCC